ncbi:MAG: geranylgeranylglyceryl/heptaprenylglyceryl phosphate synthase [Chlorobi bacterium]|nr:geranylgeranylglyceryl/heptaprenylglyceryl phosphate synthase [Chlorobiota bacterium]
MEIYRWLKKVISEKGAAFLIVLDPDNLSEETSEKFIPLCKESDVDGFLIGGSLMTRGDIGKSIETVKRYSDLPVIIFPGSVNQISEKADAILFLSLISGRNSEHLIGSHVIAAPAIKRMGIEPISTGYMLIESGKATTAQYISGSAPIPRNKPEIAAATALAGEYLGMKLIYLEGGSGADWAVPNKMISKVKESVSIPVMVGGGIRDAKTAAEKVNAGASVVIVGNHLEDENNWALIKELAEAIHNK